MDRKSALEIGCGEEKTIDGSIGIDIRKVGMIDVIADARNLPFKNNCFDHVYSSHAIEHFSHLEVREVLSEWIRVLKEGGTFELRCPDLRARALLFFLSPSWENVKNIYGGQDYPENYHKSGYSYELLKQLLKDLGIRDIKRIIKGYMGIPFIPDCLHIRGKKNCKIRKAVKDI